MDATMSNKTSASLRIQPNGTADGYNWPANLTHSTHEHVTYASYLKKQGALFKQWKERYFVLDSVKHQVRSKHVDAIGPIWGSTLESSIIFTLSGFCCFFSEYF
jgi:hypothetical protein